VEDLEKTGAYSRAGTCRSGACSTRPAPTFTEKECTVEDVLEVMKLTEESRDMFGPWNPQRFQASTLTELQKVDEAVSRKMGEVIKKMYLGVGPSG